MKNVKKGARLLALLLALIFILDVPVPAVSSEKIHAWQDALDGALEWIIANNPNPSVGDEWEIIATARAGVDARDWYKSYLAALYTELAGLEVWTDLQRVTLALTALGIDAADFNGHDLTAAYRDFLPGAHRPAHSRGVNAVIFALLALDSGNYPGDRAQYVQAILAAQTPAGAWAFGFWQSIDLTAMAIQALAPYYGENAAVRAAIGRGLDWIAGEYIVSSEEIAQVIAALTALGRSASEYVDKLLAFRDTATGGFSHTIGGAINSMSTEQVARGLVAYYRFNNDMYTFFDMRDAKDLTAPPPSPTPSPSPSPTPTPSPSPSPSPSPPPSIPSAPLPLPPPPRRAHISVSHPHANHTFFSGYFDLATNETAFSLLQRTNLALVARGTYVVSIAGLAEFDYGANSGWMFSVNDEFPQFAASMATLNDGDRVEWLYTQDLGQDVGGDTGGGGSALPPPPAPTPTPTPTPTPPPPPTVENEDGEATHPPEQEAAPGQAPETEQATETEQAPETEQATPADITADRVNPFTDISPGDWFYNYVRFAYENALMTGTAQGVFSPELHLSRAMLVTILWRLDGSPFAESDGAFADVQPGHWYSSAIAWASESGIISGFGDGTFQPNGNITREQFAAILRRYAKFRSADTYGGSLTGFDDSDDISAWALEDMQWAVAAGIILGRTPTTLAPGGTATRAEAAAMLQRFIKWL